MSDPLLALMKTIREAHNRSQLDVAMCIGIAEDTYRHIEKGAGLCLTFNVDSANGYAPSLPALALHQTRKLA